jgi:hypothetical protein
VPHRLTQNFVQFPGPGFIGRIRRIRGQRRVDAAAKRIGGISAPPPKAEHGYCNACPVCYNQFHYIGDDL